MVVLCQLMPKISMAVHDGALQLVELRLAKVPTDYKPVFRREGVFHEIESLASRPIASTKTKDKGAAEKDISEAPPPADIGINIAMPVSISVISTMPYKKLSSLTMQPDDAITLRARIISFKHLASDDAAGSDDLFINLRRLVDRINDPALLDKDLSAALMELAALFGSQHTSVSSFELLQSGVINGLLRFFADAEHQSKCITLLLSQRRYLRAHCAPLGGLSTAKSLR
ncbi:hypothetical protein BN946_scf184942.g86 [Trametes cinnabarina]|uniref:Uncharacterized protein n=1 Tax=Pycnoporus cinnabarinus TaxID=5643 RepID=A0A060S7U0_PYCCI|nr:hypothetical protein BN946_scf184942.g86 [Trametes cinnabarina]